MQPRVGKRPLMRADAIRLEQDIAAGDHPELVDEDGRRFQVLGVDPRSSYSQVVVLRVVPIDPGPDGTFRTGGMRGDENR